MLTSLLRRPARALMLLLSIGLMMASGCAAMAGRQDESNPSPENVRILSEQSDRKIVQLDNGLVVMAQRIPTAPVASVQCWIKTGAIYEGEYNGAGLSHFLEHLVSGGTTSTRPEGESTRILGQIGAQTNAATGLDTVRYYINTSAEHADRAIGLISDWMQHSQIPQEQYARERDVIQEEFAMGRGDPGRIFWKLTMRARYRRHPARHPVIGYLDEFKQVTRDQIYEFYRRMYVPNNMVFVVAGDIQPDRVIEQVAELWEDAERQDLPEIIFPGETNIDGPRSITGYADIERPRLRLAWPGTRLGDQAEGDYALDLLAGVLGQGELSRLVQVVRDRKQLATSINAFNASFAWGEGFFGVDAVVDPGGIEEAKRAIREVIDELQAEGITEDELERAKRKTIAQVVYETQTVQAAASRLASDFIHMGDPDYLQRYAHAIKDVSREDVLEAARTYLQPDRLITIKLLPQEGTPELLGRPEETRPARRWRKSDDAEVVHLDNARLVERMMELKNVDSERIEPAAEPGPIRMHVLDSGLRLLVQENPRLPIVAMKWYHLGGLMADEPGREGVANAMAQMMVKGAGKMTADEISRRVENLGARLSTDSGNSTFTANALSLAGDWPAVLSLMAKVIQESTFPEDEWAKMKPRLLAAIASLDDQWHAQLRNGFREAYFGEHPWSQPIVGRADVVESLTVDRLREFHDNRINAKDSVLAVFGDVDQEKVVRRVKELFGDMPSEAEIPFEAHEHEPIEPRIVQIESGKPTTAFQIGYGPGLALSNPDYAPMLVMNSVLNAWPSGWLPQALRGEEGLAYAVGSGMMTGVAPGYWAALANPDTPDLGEAMRRVLDITHRIRTTQVDQRTLERARNATLVREALDRQSNGQRATDAALNELYGVGYDWSKKLIEEIRSVDAAEIQRVAQEYLETPLATILINEPVDKADLPPLDYPQPEQQPAAREAEAN